MKGKDSGIGVLGFGGQGFYDDDNADVLADGGVEAGDVLQELGLRI
jgi:hypothetical protein